MEFRRHTLEQIAAMICGHIPDSFFSLSQWYSANKFFFQDCGIDYVFPERTYYYNSYDIVDEWEYELLMEHNESLAEDKQQVIEVLKTILNEPKTNDSTPPKTFLRVIETLMDCGDAFNEVSDRRGALALLNDASL